MQESNLENFNAPEAGDLASREETPEPGSENPNLETREESDGGFKDIEVVEPAEGLESAYPAATLGALSSLNKEIAAGEQKIGSIENNMSDTQEKIARAREDLGLSPSAEKPPNIEAYEKELADLRQQQEIFLAQKREFEAKLKEFEESGVKIPEMNIDGIWEEALKADPGIKERAKIESDNLVQEKLDKLYDEFQALAEKDQLNLIQAGIMVSGASWQSRAVGGVSPENARELAKGFKEGKKDLAYFAGKLGKFIGMLARTVWEFARGVAIGLRKQ